jgi:hypothetical protein
VATGAGVIPPTKTRNPPAPRLESSSSRPMAVFRSVARIDDQARRSGRPRSPGALLRGSHRRIMRPVGRQQLALLGGWLLGGHLLGHLRRLPRHRHTANYGATWTEENPGKGLTGEEEPLSSISCSNTNLCLANSTRTIVRTTNGGAIWTRVLLNSNLGAMPHVVMSARAGTPGARQGQGPPSVRSGGRGPFHRLAFVGQVRCRLGSSQMSE